MKEFDYIVVGGGAGGCAVAGRLSEDPDISVCLLEAGKSDDQTLIKTPFCTAVMLPTPLNNWAFQTVPQPGLNGRRGYVPRGKALGGSSSINAMIYNRGHPWDYDHWAALGNGGWSWREVLSYFKKSEHNENFQDDYHGQGGPLNVANLRSMNPFQEIYLEAARQAGFPLIDDFNGAEQEGVGIHQVTQKNGERWNAARAYLTPHLASRPNLTVITQARARRILFTGKRASGVEFLQEGELQVFQARRELILSAGALQSPQLLLLSGIGAGAELQEFGIPVIHDLPGVGKNLQDHPDYVFNYRAKSLDLIGFSFAGSLHLMKEISRYRKDRTGLITTNGAEGGGFLRRFPDSPVPDFQLHFVVGLIDNHVRKLHWGHGYSCHVCLLRPKSIGTVSLASNDPVAAPRIDPKFFDHPDDLDAMVDGFKLTRKIMDAPALANIRSGELYTAGIHSDDEIREELRNRSDTIYHPVGTCKMGTDAMAVVDARLRVHGLEGLRVVDASIMPTLIGGNTNAPTMMIGEKAAEMIRTDVG
ncbi:MAG: GMC family oxidoreductase N-terminal domain-containing protein [Rhodocyclales bacterium]|nr:GMC family oxidoreductase N-terminal domain-containing protein [Rhodocyclales bacterium]